MIQAGWNILLGEVATSWASWFLFPFLVFSGVRIYDIYAPDLIGLQVIRDGIPQLVSIIPFAYYWYYVGASTSCILVCFFSHQKCFSLFCDNGPDFREIELM